MKLMEYQARECFGKYDIPIMAGIVVDELSVMGTDLDRLSFPVVVKAQVQAGGRGKAGGVRFAHTQEEAKRIASEMLHSKIKGLAVKRILIVEKADGIQECYLSIMLDRTSKCPCVIFSGKGGVDVEETAVEHPEMIFQVRTDPTVGIRRYMASDLLSRAGMPIELTEKLYTLMKNLYCFFMVNDITLAEINPLLVCANGGLVALDGKVDVDDSALYRQPWIQEYRAGFCDEALEAEAREHDLLYISVEEKGDVAVISNGSGMLMSSMDLISKAGMTIGAVMDLGGGAASGKIKEAIRIMFKNPRIRVLYLNIFGGITRCDEVSCGILEAMDLIPADGRIVLRLEGTNKEEGLALLCNAGEKIISVNGLVEGVEAIQR